MTKARLFIFVLFFTVVADCRAGDQFFTVRDSIEMSHFSSNVQFSPDGRYFAIVTSRGIIHSNSVASTLWIFSSAAVRTYVQSNTINTTPPKPFAIATVREVPRMQADDYAPLIPAFQWLPNSTDLLFQAYDSRGEQRLYQVDLASKGIRVVTPVGRDVSDVVYTQRTIIYRAMPFQKTQIIGNPINAAATDVTGMPLHSILFPSERLNGAGNDNLWIIRGSHTREIIRSDSLLPLALPRENNFLVADGNSVIVSLPVEQIPPSWANYEPVPTSPHLRISPASAFTTLPSNILHPFEYFVVNLSNGNVTPLVHAPNAWALGSQDSGGAVWSPSGKKVLVMGTFLPFENVPIEEQHRRRYPCAAAIVDIRTRKADCITFSSSYGYHLGKSGSEILQAASFGTNDNEVVLHFIELDSNSVEKYYRYEKKHWKREQLARIPRSKASNLTIRFSVGVKEDLNTPPVLWVTDEQTGVRKKLWDPNPQLRWKNLGKASIFHWKDASGYQWMGGLLKPPDYMAGKRYPLVIQDYTFDPNEFLSDGPDTTSYAARPLASAGMIVLEMPRNTEHQPGLQEIPDQILGYESAITELSAAGIVDPQKVGIIGFSWTCLYVEGAMIQAPQLFAAASLTDGPDESYLQYLTDADTDPGVLGPVNIYGTKPFARGLPVWVKNAPGFNLDRVQTPLLITALSPDVVLEEWEIYASLRMQKKPVDLMYLPQVAGYQHVLQRPLERLASQQTNVDWFSFWLQGREEPDSARAAQYRRWESLRKLQRPSTHRYITGY